MRIIAGEFRSRRLHTPPDGSITRPIPDRVKESLFGFLRGHCEGATVFDGFAGTGAIGLEAVSRGASRCVCIEQDKSIATILSSNIEMLDVKDRCEVVVGDALGAGALARAPRPLTIAFLDPPYPLVEEPVGYRRVMAQLEKLVDLLSPDGIAVLRTPWPLRHAQGGTGAAPEVAEAPRSFKKHKGKYDRREWRRMVEGKGEPVPGAEDAPEVEEVPVKIVTPVPAPEAKVVWLDVDLKLPNAAGPETHTYHNMALHLYMRKKA